MPKSLKRKTILVSELTDTVTREMFVLFELYYDHVTYQKFLEDLREKTHVFMFYDQTNGRLAGFSTIYRKKLPHISRGIFLFSGDTVVHQDYWGAKSLQKSFFWFILESKLISPFAPVYWMLMSKGVKTYLLMRKNFVKSFPNGREATPAEFKRVRDAFYEMKFGPDFNPATELILFKEKLGAVKEVHVTPSTKVLSDPESVYFYQKNPKHQDGDELACICEIRFADFFFHVFKFFIPILKRR